MSSIAQFLTTIESIRGRVVMYSCLQILFLEFQNLRGQDNFQFTKGTSNEKSLTLLETYLKAVDTIGNYSK